MEDEKKAISAKTICVALKSNESSKEKVDTDWIKDKKGLKYVRILGRK